MQSRLDPLQAPLDGALSEARDATAARSLTHNCAFLTTLFAGGHAKHIPFVFASWAANPTFDFYVATPDARLARLYKGPTWRNIHFVVRPLAELHSAVLTMLGVPGAVRLKQTFKFSTIHTALGTLFHEHLKVDLDEYGWWGWVDTDVILGNLSFFWARHMHGHLSSSRQRFELLTVQPPLSLIDLKSWRPPAWRDDSFRFANNWGPTVLLNAWLRGVGVHSRELWREVTRKQEKLWANHPGISYTAINECPSGCPPDAWWTDEVFNTLYMPTSPISVPLSPASPSVSPPCPSSTPSHLRAR